jgi:hypothetical protein
MIDNTGTRHARLPYDRYYRNASCADRYYRNASCALSSIFDIYILMFTTFVLFYFVVMFILYPGGLRQSLRTCVPRSSTLVFLNKIITCNCFIVACCQPRATAFT